MDAPSTDPARRGLLSLVVGVALLGTTVGCGDDDATPTDDAPAIASLTADAQILDPGETTTIRVTANEANGGGQSAEGLADGLSAQWSTPAEDWTLDGSEGSAEVTAPDSYRRTAAIAVEVSNPNRATATETIDLTTGTNASPRLTSVSAKPNPVEPGGTVQLDAAGSDTRGDELSYSWTTPGDWTLDSQSGSSTELRAPDREDASTEVTVNVTDPAGGEAGRTIPVSTSSDEPPRIQSMTATPPQVAPGETVTVAVDATDDESDSLDYDWSAPDPWTVDGSGDQVDVKAPDIYAKTARVSVEISDDRDQTASARVVVSTRSNDRPTIRLLSASPRQADRGEEIQLRVDAGDPNGDDLSYDWTAPGEDWSVTPNGDEATLQTPDAPGQSTEVAVEVSDGGRSTEASTVVSTHPNGSPTLDSISVEPSRVAPDGEIELSATASDPEDDPLTWNWIPADPSLWSVSGKGSSVKLQAPDRYGESSSVRVVVTDGPGDSDSETLQVSTEANSPPVINSLTARPPEVAPSGTTDIEALVSDPDGDSLTYEWRVPSPWVKGKTSKSSTVEATAPPRTNSSVRVELEVDDGNGAETRATVAVRTPLNKSPVITKLTANPTELEPKQTTMLQVQASDPEGDPLTYDWRLPGKWAGSSQSSTIQVTAPRVYSANQKLFAEVGDGTTTSTQSVNVETVDNRPPTIDSLNVPKTTLNVGESVFITVQASDPYGDPLTYDWSNTNKQWDVNPASGSAQLTPTKPGSTSVTVEVKDGFGMSVTSRRIDLTAQ